MGATAPGETVEQFPDERSELGKQGYVSGLLFLRKRTPRTSQPRPLFAFPITIIQTCNSMKKIDNRKGGRPSKPTDEKRTHTVTIKLTDVEYFDLRKRSKSAGVKLSKFIRHGAFRLTIVSRLNEIETEIAQKILRMSSDFNQALTWLNSLKLRRAADKLLAVVDAMFDILKKLRPNKETDYVCKNT